jgi:hypothetical protein
VQFVLGALQHYLVCGVLKSFKLSAALINA